MTTETKEVHLEDNFDEAAHNKKMQAVVKNLEEGNGYKDPEEITEESDEQDDETSALSDYEKLKAEYDELLALMEEHESQDDGDSVEEVIDEAGLDMDSLKAEFEETGGLSEDSYEALEAAGIPRETVDVYLEGISAQIELMQLKAYELAGGEQGYKSLMQWAEKALTQDEIAAFNQTVETNDFRQFSLAVKGLQARYQANYGSYEDNLSGSQTAVADRYNSTAEVMKDMADPRYETDTAFQQKVAAKLQRSNVL